jgi:hypothetical protein
MSTLRGRSLAFGLSLGLITGSAVEGQDPPTLLPPLPSTPIEGRRLQAEGPSVMPAPTVVVVPPGGPRPSWVLRPADPVALVRHPPKHVDHKARSWHWRRLQGKMLGYPEEFEPRPLGAALYDHGRTMVANGAAARLTLFDYDFVQGSNRLNARGREQLAKAAAQLVASPYPLIIEKIARAPGLAESRRDFVLNELAEGSTPIDPARVLVGLPTPGGLSGIEAQIIQLNTLSRTQQYGPPIPINSNGVNSPSGVTSGGAGLIPGQ